MTDMQPYDELIHELSDLCGIIPEYWDTLGNKHLTSAETNKIILRAMKLEVDSPEGIRQEIEERKKRPWKDLIEPVTVVSVREQPLVIPVYLPVPEGGEERLSISWSLVDEEGHEHASALSGDDLPVADQKWIDGIRYIRVDLPEQREREIGYYSIQVESTHPDPIFQGETRAGKTARIIITPDVCYIPAALTRNRTWGLSLNLYAIRSERNWGVGDFSDLKGIVRWISGLKGGLAGINPLHAIPNTKPFGISPYSPISRLYKNSIYLDCEEIPEVKESKHIRDVLRSGILLKEVADLRETEFVDYEKTASLKESILRKAFERFYENHYTRNTTRGRAFREYLAGEGPYLESFATYMALASSQHRDAKAGDVGTRREEPQEATSSHPLRFSRALNWQEWHEEYHHPSGEAVREFRKTGKKEILFYQYIQWLIDEQMGEVAHQAEYHSMGIGLYHDLAIGSVGGGSDAWCQQDVIAGEIDVGAPPDDFNLNGQNWGFPPSIPEALKETGYEFFIQTIRKNMKHCGALRIDHALGMFRLFWIPRGMHPREGAYVRYPSEDLLRIIALESVRNRTMVIAEDLGTISEHVRETLERFHMLSYRLFYFERDYPDPSFSPPDGYPELALCAVTTHDLPTLYGYWTGRDLEVKKQLGMYRDDSQWQEQVREREKDRKRILSALEAQGILTDQESLSLLSRSEMTPELCLAVYQYLLLTPCKVVLASLDDVIGALDQQNMPGIVDGYHSWMRKTPITFEAMARDRRFLSLSEIFRKDGHRV